METSENGNSLQVAEPSNKAILFPLYGVKKRVVAEVTSTVVTATPVVKVNLPPTFCRSKSLAETVMYPSCAALTRTVIEAP